MLKLVNYRWLLLLMAMLTFAVSCDDEDPEAELPIASFQAEIDSDDFLKVNFKNFSLNAVSYSWNFGDNSTVSTEEEPSHTYTAGGTYQVTLTATNADGKTNEKTESIVITNPDEELATLTGTTSKSWKLLRETSSGLYPMMIAAADGTATHWTLGGATAIESRPCAMNDEFIFSADGTYEYKTNGDYWNDAGPFGPFGDDIGEACINDDDANFVGKTGQDLSAWNAGVHEFTLNTDEDKLTVTGLGAFIALQKVGNGAEVSTPQESVTYDVLRLAESDVDTLIIQSVVGGNVWTFVLVHYDDPTDEPALPPSAGFTYEADGFAVEFSNTSSGAVSYEWDFGDGNSSSEESPSHTYDEAGNYTVELTVTNAAGSNSTSELIIIGGAACTSDEAQSLDPSTGIKLTNEDLNSAFNGFDGIAAGRVENPFVGEGNMSCYVNRFERSGDGCQTWNGAALTLPTAINFASDKKKFKMKVYGVSDTTIVHFRLEKNPYPDVEPSAERTAEITAVGEWQELTFDFSDIADPNTYKSLIIYFKRGRCDEAAFFFDDLEQID
jgi:PKD repeat protein